MANKNMYITFETYKGSYKGIYKGATHSICRFCLTNACLIDLRFYDRFVLLVSILEFIGL